MKSPDVEMRSLDGLNRVRNFKATTVCIVLAILELIFVMTTVVLLATIPNQNPYYDYGEGQHSRCGAFAGLGFHGLITVMLLYGLIRRAHHGLMWPHIGVQVIQLTFWFEGMAVFLAFALYQLASSAFGHRPPLSLSGRAAYERWAILLMVLVVFSIYFIYRFKVTMSAYYHLRESRQKGTRNGNPVLMDPVYVAPPAYTNIEPLILKPEEKKIPLDAETEDLVFSVEHKY